MQYLSVLNIYQVWWYFGHIDTLHLPTPEGWKAKLAWLADPQRTIYQSYFCVKHCWHVAHFLLVCVGSLCWNYWSSWSWQDCTAVCSGCWNALQRWSGADWQTRPDWWLWLNSARCMGAACNTSRQHPVWPAVWLAEIWCRYCRLCLAARFKGLLTYICYTDGHPNKRSFPAVNGHTIKRI